MVRIKRKKVDGEGNLPRVLRRLIDIKTSDLKVLNDSLHQAAVVSVKESIEFSKSRVPEGDLKGQIRELETLRNAVKGKSINVSDITGTSGLSATESKRVEEFSRG